MNGLINVQLYVFQLPVEVVFPQAFLFAFEGFYMVTLLEINETV
jgi:hypothetical protein